MFSILGNLYSKFMSVIVSIMVAVGIVSAPPSIPTVPVVTTTSDVVIDNSNELADVSKQITNLKADLESEKQKRQELEKAIVSQPKEAQTNIQNTSLQSTLGVKTFALPSGGIIDEFGNIISAPQSIQTSESPILTSTQISTHISPSVVLISTLNGNGSGFAINQGREIVTNAHVVKGNSFVDIKLQDGRKVAGTVLGRDESVDLAIILLTPNVQLPSLVLGTSNSISIGSDVYALGFPFSTSFFSEDLSTITLTKGILSAKQKVSWYNGTLLQTNSAINPGNSGGPLVNDRGEVVGVNTFNLPGAQGIYFAIPVETLKALLPNLKAGLQNIIFTPPVAGSTVTIPRSMAARIGLNPDLSCENLTYTGNNLRLCNLYKNNKSAYQWTIDEDK